MLNEKKIVSRIEEKLHQFFKMLNEKTFNLFNEGKFDYLIIAGRKDICLILKIICIVISSQDI
jgi:hypothetical protein